jgi:hypothetical protein
LNANGIFLHFANLIWLCCYFWTNGQVMQLACRLVGDFLLNILTSFMLIVLNDGMECWHFVGVYLRVLFDISPNKELCMTTTNSVERNKIKCCGCWGL